MNGRHKALAISVSAATLAAMLGGAGVTAQSGKEGGSVPPVALEMAVAEWAGSGRVDTFAAKVDELSGGQMRIDVDWDGGAEDVVPGRVQAGEADLGWVYARGLNAADVHDLDALIAPFLVSDGRLLNEVITGPVGADMLAGLAGDGLEGLALLPGNQRFFVGIGNPLATPADFDGARLALVRTPFLDRLVESLGAEAVSFEQDDPASYEAQGVDGIITVADNLALFPGTFMTSNLVPYTVPTVILANAETMADLTPEQQKILRAAAVEVRDQLLAEMPDVESSAVRCGIGASVIEATDADVDAMETAAQPVRDWLASDPATAAFIERIETLKAELPAPAWPATCGAAPRPDATVAGIPDGTYRAAGTHQDSLRTGWESDCDLDLVDEHIALVISGGGTDWTALVACGDRPLEVGAAGTLEYSASGDQFTQLEPGYPRGPTYAWSFDGGALTLTIVAPGEPSEEDLKAAKFLFERTFTLDGADAPIARIPDGTYTTQVTKADAVRTGFEDECALSDQVKTVMLVIEGDRFTELQACGDGPAEIGSDGTLEFSGDQVVMRTPGLRGEATFSWRLDGDTFGLEAIDGGEFAPLSVMRFLFEHEFVRSSS